MKTSSLFDFVASRQRIVVVTGAGVSTGSGIGDYRDDEGHWKGAAPVQHGDFVSQVYWRKRYWARSQRGFVQFMQAQPNAGHRALRSLEERGHVLGVITQNVDRLHQAAGQQSVIDLHGRLDEVICLDCAAVCPRRDLQAWLERHNPAVDDATATPRPDGDAQLNDFDYGAVCVPDCERCGGILKPHVVFYGDGVPKVRVEQAYEWVDHADGLLVVGTSMMVFSSFRFARRAHQRGVPIAIVNRGRTRADDLASLKVNEDCSTALTALVAALEVNAANSP
ncbi:MAG: NAD-dependent protein deacetylase [Pseudomonadota bacterium]